MILSTTNLEVILISLKSVFIVLGNRSCSSCRRPLYLCIIASRTHTCQVTGILPNSRLDVPGLSMH